ncbi:uncharacterized protein F4812DRAFT_350335 [Daldinia caldariorum]|uniref:uncharacterized protein n=1 Tax=Daldinia caldariorum TaxID=326644 RepID=UPI002008DCA7|nr:uncharacterized protein F4812DRAFT_350335 [Daldinia caldariorum]KAI1468896.1 hypothetical protein F4812DRAFT_350335 [Daldinia caldariorum]
MFLYELRSYDIPRFSFSFFKKEYRIIPFYIFLIMSPTNSTMMIVSKSQLWNLDHPRKNSGYFLQHGPGSLLSRGTLIYKVRRPLHIDFSKVKRKGRLIFFRGYSKGVEWSDIYFLSFCLFLFLFYAMFLLLFTSVLY